MSGDRGVVVIPARRRQACCWTPISDDNNNNSRWLDNLKGIDESAHGDDRWAPVFEFVYENEKKLEFHVTDPSAYIEPNQKVHKYLALLGVRLDEEDVICTDVVVTAGGGELLQYDIGQIIIGRINELS